MMGTEIFKIDASCAKKLTEMRVSFLMNPSVKLIEVTLPVDNCQDNHLDSLVSRCS